MRKRAIRISRRSACLDWRCLCAQSALLVAAILLVQTAWFKNLVRVRIESVDRTCHRRAR